MPLNATANRKLCSAEVVTPYWLFIVELVTAGASILLLLLLLLLMSHVHTHTPIRIPHSPSNFISMDPADASANALQPSPLPATQQSLRNLTRYFLLGAH